MDFGSAALRGDGRTKRAQSHSRFEYLNVVFEVPHCLQAKSSPQTGTVLSSWPSWVGVCGGMSQSSVVQTGMHASLWGEPVV